MLVDVVVEQAVVVIVGAGPSGLATSACLNNLSIPNIILEKESFHASLWKLRTYDRLKLHLAKEFCNLPHMPFSPSAPTYISKDDFIRYLDNYVSKFNLSPRYHRLVKSASCEKLTGRWQIEVENTKSGETELYIAEFLVVASGENAEGYIPKIHGLHNFVGEITHSRDYKSGSKYSGKDVLVVGCGNSGMEIAYDLAESKACTSIVIRSSVHILTKEMVHLGMVLLKYLPLSFVDSFITLISRFWYGDLAKYGIERPANGPFYIKATQGRSAVIDVGTVKKIKEGEIKVLPELVSVQETNLKFSNGEIRKFDAIIFATGYKSGIHKWLKEYGYIFNEEGLPKNKFPNHWRGSNGLYCAGFSRRGLAGVSMDAVAIAQDINLMMVERRVDIN
ncbi:hypothetical protein Scep_002335 [Stephania cephalantha]|uniref:Flavin-containing monooxygenase n=1 Tax=Stephania cephalantha TaxID=152367 RepID=A0AAP0LDS9_9MAGN